MSRLWFIFLALVIAPDVACADAVADVKAVALRKFRAIEAGDEKAIIALWPKLDEAVREAVLLDAEESRQYNRLGRILFKRFPKEAAESWPECEPTEDAEYAQWVADAVVTFEKDKATLVLNGGKGKTVCFRKIDGEWKVDAVLKFYRERLAQVSAAAAARAAKEVADRVEKGKVRSAREAKELYERLEDRYVREADQPVQ